MRVMSTSSDVIDAANAVHDELGSGFTESVYHRSLETELSRQGIEFSSEGTIPVMYRGKSVGRRRPDLFIELDSGTAVVELKAGSNSGDDQLLQYVELLDDDNNFNITKGLLIRFNDDVETEEASP